MVDSMADELVRKLRADTDEGVISLAETFKRSRSREEKIDAMIVFETINYEKYSQKSRDIVVDALIKGLRNKDDEILTGCAEALSKEDLINKVSPELRERAVNELVFMYENRGKRSFTRENLVLALGNIDYSGIAPEMKKKVLDILVSATQSKAPDIREWAANGIDKIGDEDATKKVAGYWMPFLDTEYGGRVFEIEDEFNRRTALDIFSRMGWPPAADHEALLIKNGGLKDLDFIQVGAIFNVITHCGSEKHEDVVLKATKEAIAANDDVNLSFDTLGRIGTEKSKAVLNEFIDKNKKNRDPYVRGYVEEAREAVKEIEKRIGVSVKPAEETLKKSIGKEKVRVK
jgi:hypothetical protein